MKSNWHLHGLFNAIGHVLSRLFWNIFVGNFGQMQLSLRTLQTNFRWICREVMSLPDIFTKSGIFLNVKWIFRMSFLPVLWRIFFCVKTDGTNASRGNVECYHRKSIIPTSCVLDKNYFYNRNITKPQPIRHGVPCSQHL